MAVYESWWDIFGKRSLILFYFPFQHEPLIPIARLLNRGKPSPNITIELAALEVGAAGRQWLLDNLRNQNVYLRLIRRTEGVPSVQAEMIAYRVRFSG
jgi:hypothetical protein